MSDDIRNAARSSTPVTVPPPEDTMPSNISKARLLLKRLARAKSVGAVLLGIIAVGWIAKTYDGHLATKDELGTIQSTQASVVTDVAVLRAKFESLSSDMGDLHKDLRLISAQLVEIAKTTGARQVLPPSPATTP